MGNLGMPVVFNDIMSHDAVLCALSHRDNLVSAGFCRIDNNGKYVCYGESTTLKVKSRGIEDSQVLNRMLGIAHSEY
jgi:hypothetical protein